MHTAFLMIGSVLLAGQSLLAAAQDPKQLVHEAVQTELVASQNDHSRWMYYDVDHKPGGTTFQWVAETGNGSLHRMLTQKDQPLSPAAQRSTMDNFIQDPSVQDRQRKSGEHDDRQSADMLRLLPDAFLWKIVAARDGKVLLHFAPDPQFKPPTWDARVFAAMEGDMQVEASHHRIVSLRGKLVHDVRFCGGLCGSLSAGGTFDVERRQIGPSIWMIVETHLHIRGTALLFKNISQEEDEQKTCFHPLPGNVSLQQAESTLLQQPEDQTAAMHASPSR
jgi:hypothetical protein